MGPFGCKLPTRESQCNGLLRSKPLPCSRPPGSKPWPGGVLVRPAALQCDPCRRALLVPGMRVRDVAQRAD